MSTVISKMSPILLNLEVNLYLSQINTKTPRKNAVASATFITITFC